MKIEINIDDRIVAGTKRVFSRRNVTLACLGGLLASVAAYAATVDVPNTFQPNTVISSSEVNANFEALADSFVFTNSETSKGYALNATYCGVTGDISSSLGGYVGAKAQCESTCVSATAHVCTSEEVLRYVSTGGTMIPAGTYRVVAGSRSDNSGSPVNDCDGFKSDLSTATGHAWDFPSAQPGYRACGQGPLLCCD